MSWTDERIELLKRLWGDGLSASQIAAEMGEISRNAVIGKVHRLGLAGRARPAASPLPRPKKPTAPRLANGGGHGGGGGRDSSIVRSAIVRGNTALVTMAVAQALPVRETMVAVPVVVPLSDPITIMELREHTCRWPLGDPTNAEFRYCGAHKGEATGPYCSHHARMAYQPVADRRRDRRH